jgi:excinuclease ABC subunit A
VTGEYLAGRRKVIASSEKRENRCWLHLRGARGHNLQNIDVGFPLGVLCLVTGVSGAGKSSLVIDTLYGALLAHFGKDGESLPHDELAIEGQIDDCLLIDRERVSRSPRSNPVTYIKAFDDIRAVFAESPEARVHNYTASHFSFNVDGGRCPTCQGDGCLAIDMQFLPDVYMTCPDCGGTRYRKEILAATYRGQTIAEVLNMTVREAFPFFRGQTKLQGRLKKLIDVGLDYLRLGQPANTLSSGESQRLKIASFLATARKSRTLILMEEPASGLHFADVATLVECFSALVGVGHSLIVIDHNVDLMQAADHIIDLGPGAAENGGRIVCQGPPEAIAKCAESPTGRVLAEALGREP